MQRRKVFDWRHLSVINFSVSLPDANERRKFRFRPLNKSSGDRIEPNGRIHIHLVSMSIVECLTAEARCIHHGKAFR
jgi:hypothetical protein